MHGIVQWISSKVPIEKFDLIDLIQRKDKRARLRSTGARRVRTGSSAPPTGRKRL
jgi:hypothetical protein